jgi:hypothetical protein
MSDSQEPQVSKRSGTGNIALILCCAGLLIGVLFPGVVFITPLPDRDEVRTVFHVLLMFCAVGGLYVGFGLFVLGGIVAGVDLLSRTEGRKTSSKVVLGVATCVIAAVTYLVLNPLR